jgi:hypothetical protein
MYDKHKINFYTNCKGSFQTGMTTLHPKNQLKNSGGKKSSISISQGPREKFKNSRMKLRQILKESRYRGELECTGIQP